MTCQPTRMQAAGSATARRCPSQPITERSGHPRKTPVRPDSNPPGPAPAAPAGDVAFAPRHLQDPPQTATAADVQHRIPRKTTLARVPSTATTLATLSSLARRLAAVCHLLLLALASSLSHSPVSVKAPPACGEDLPGIRSITPTSPSTTLSFPALTTRRPRLLEGTQSFPKRTRTRRRMKGANDPWV